MRARALLHWPFVFVTFRCGEHKTLQNDHRLPRRVKAATERRLSLTTSARPLIFFFLRAAKSVRVNVLYVEVLSFPKFRKLPLRVESRCRAVFFVRHVVTAPPANLGCFWQLRPFQGSRACLLKSILSIYYLNTGKIPNRLKLPTTPPRLVKQVKLRRSEYLMTSLKRLCLHTVKCLLREARDKNQSCSHEWREAAAALGETVPGIR